MKINFADFNQETDAKEIHKRRKRKYAKFTMKQS